VAPPTYRQLLFGAQEERVVRSETELRIAIQSIAESSELAVVTSQFSARANSRIVIAKPIFMDSGLTLPDDVKGLEIVTAGFAPLYFGAVSTAITVDADFVRFSNVSILAKTGTAGPTTAIVANSVSNISMSGGIINATNVLTGDISDSRIRDMIAAGNIDAEMDRCQVDNVRELQNVTLDDSARSKFSGCSMQDLTLTGNSNRCFFTSNEMDDVSDSASAGYNVFVGNYIVGTTSYDANSVATGNV
jgi:hypothetical protein